jgi:hypothetical protein
MLRAVAYSVMLLLTIGQNVRLCCEAECNSQPAAVTDCHEGHRQSMANSPSASVHHECAQVTLGVGTFLPEAGRRTASPDASDAISSLHDQRPQLTSAECSDQRAMRGCSGHAPPLTIALRI